MYKLVAIDLDGTLLNSNKQISNEDKEAINQAVNRGIKVIICSGRIYAGARIFARYLGINGAVIACNGAVIKDLEKGEVLYNDFLRMEDCIRALEICNEDDMYFHIYADDTMYTEKLEFSSEFYWKRNLELPKEDRIEIKLINNLKDEMKNFHMNTSKIVVVSDNLEKLSKVRRKVEESYSISVMSSNFDNFEIVNRGVSKGNALKFLSGKLGIKKDEIIAIGDNENDYSMLDFAGLGVAMGNAEEYIKGIADYITSSNNENGVSEVFKKFIL